MPINTNGNRAEQNQKSSHSLGTLDGDTASAKGVNTMREEKGNDGKA